MSSFLFCNSFNPDYCCFYIVYCGILLELFLPNNFFSQHPYTISYNYSSFSIIEYSAYGNPYIVKIYFLYYLSNSCCKINTYFLCCSYFPNMIFHFRLSLSNCISKTIWLVRVPSFV